MNRQTIRIAAQDWLDAIPVAACVVDSELGLQSANPRFRNLISPHLVSLQAFFRECDAELPETLIANALANGSARAEFVPAGAERRHVMQAGRMPDEELCLVTIFPFELLPGDSETHYQLLAADVAADGLVVFDETGLVLYANQAASALRGTEQPRLQRMSWSVVYPLAPAFEPVPGMVENAGRWEGETQIERYDGALATLEVVVTRLERGVYCAHERDVTLRRLAEYVFLESERLHEAFFSQSLDGFFIMLAEAPVDTARLKDDIYLGELVSCFRLAKANAPALAHFGIARGEAPAHTFLQLFGPELGRAVEFLRRLLAEGRRNAEFPLKSSAGTSIIEGDYICLRDDDGNITGFFGIQRDVTRKKHDAALLERRTRALESAYELATTVDSGEEKIVQLLKRVSELLCFPVVRLSTKAFGLRTWHLEPTGAAWWSHGVDGPATLTGQVLSMGRSIRTAAPWAELFEGAPPSGFDGPLQFLGVPVRKPNGQVLGALCGVGVNLPEDPDDDLRLLELFAAYIGHETERQHLAEHFQRSRRMELLGQITAGVAHEVRNPLNAIASISEALRLELANAQYDDYLDHMRDQVNRLSALMRDMLELGRPLQSSKLQNEQIDVLVAAAVALWRQSNPARAVEVHGKLPEAGVRADGARMQQALINVLDNAHQHSPPGMPITVTLQAAGEKVRIAIADHGTGIPAEAIHKVFEPFFTLRREGTGLGMSIVKQVVEGHGGEVAIRNRAPEPGVCVEFLLPICSVTV